MNAEQESIYTLDHPAVVASLEAMSFGRRTKESQRDECYAWLRVADAVDQDGHSNLGRRNIIWIRNSGQGGGQYVYRIRMQGPWPDKEGTARITAPSTLEEARTSPLLDEASLKRDQMRVALIEKYGEPGFTKTRGLFAEIRKVLQATPEGRAYLAECPSAPDNCASAASTARAYKYEDWLLLNGKYIYMVFRAQPDRLKLIARHWTGADATAEVKRRNDEKRRAKDPRVGNRFGASANQKRARMYAAKADQQVKAGDTLDEDAQTAKKDLFMNACRDAWEAGTFDAWHWEFIDEVTKGYKLEMVA